MSTHISHEGEFLGKLKIDERNKIYFVAEGLGCLETLLSLNENDMVEIDYANPISYKTFRKEYLSRVSGFYVSLNEFLFKNYSGRTAEEVQKELDFVRGA